ncbi:hypothetical protein C8T65DRAFT_699699 [Cerioporus squamosus]|nr:hypothetical protein C8T65DRAFT_699699 [Cerioporus squamosus]
MSIWKMLTLQRAATLQTHIAKPGKFLSPLSPYLPAQRLAATPCRRTQSTLLQKFPGSRSGKACRKRVCYCPARASGRPYESDLLESATVAEVRSWKTVAGGERAYFIDYGSLLADMASAGCTHGVHGAPGPSGLCAGADEAMLRQPCTWESRTRSPEFWLCGDVCTESSRRLRAGVFAVVPSVAACVGVEVDVDADVDVHEMSAATLFALEESIESRLQGRELRGRGMVGRTDQRVQSLAICSWCAKAQQDDW